MIFRTCENCGANLDPGEKCDCKKSADMENKVYTTNDFKDIYEKYVNLITDDNSNYIETEERKKCDTEVCNQIIEPLRAEGNKIWLEYDELFSNALDAYATEGFINGYICAIAEKKL